MQYFYRYEWKYVIPNNIATAILEDLMHYGMRYDTQHPNGYTVTSLYFDSLQLNDYSDKAAGLLDRKKIRIRIYTHDLTDTTPEIWLEKKIKHDAHVRKERILITRDEYQELLFGSRIACMQKLISRGEHNTTRIVGSIYAKSMRPHVVVRYNRIPLLSSSYGGFRATIDSNVEACFGSDLCYTSPTTKVHSEHTVIEIKYTHILPPWFGVIIKKYNLERTTFSKYVESVEKLYNYHPLPR